MRGLRRWLALAWLVFWPAWVGAENITIATGEYEPWTVEKSQFGGYVNRVVREAFARRGVTVSFVFMPWKRAFEEVKAGRFQATSFWFEVEAYHRDFLYSQALSQHRELLFHLKSRPLPNWSSVTELGEFKFGATRGYSYIPEFWEAAATGRLSVEAVNSDEQNLQKLLVGRIDVFPLDEVTAWKILSNTKIFPVWARDLIMAEEKPLHVTTGHLLFPRRDPKSQELLQKFDAALLEMGKDGTLTRFREDMFRGIY